MATTKENNYRFVSKNIIYTGTRYRVRKMINGVKYDQYFKTKKEALKYRSQLNQTY